MGYWTVPFFGALLEGTYYREKLELLSSQWVRRRSNYLTRGENREEGGGTLAFLVPYFRKL